VRGAGTECRKSWLAVQPSPGPPSHSSTLPFFILMLRVEETRKSTGFFLSFFPEAARKKHVTLCRTIKKDRKLRCRHSLPAHLRVQTFRNVVLLPLSGSCGHLRRKVVIETRERGKEGSGLCGPPNLQISGYRASVPGGKADGT
jgi:hypothetical protein